MDTMIITFLLCVLVFGAQQSSGAVLSAPNINTDGIARKTLDSVEADGKTPIREEIEVDVDENVEVFRIVKENEVVLESVLDFSKSVIGIHLPQQHRCFVIGGIDSAIVGPQEMKEKFINVTTGDKYVVLQYRLVRDYPTSDVSMLPRQLQEQCRDLPVFWLERELLVKPDSSEVVRRHRRNGWSVYGTANGHYSYPPHHWEGEVGGGVRYRNGNSFEFNAGGSVFGGSYGCCGYRIGVGATWRF